MLFLTFPALVYKGHNIITFLWFYLLSNDCIKHEVEFGSNLYDQQINLCAVLWCLINKERHFNRSQSCICQPELFVRTVCFLFLNLPQCSVCVRASQESLLADRVAQLSSLCLKLPLGQSALSERSSAEATLELACRGKPKRRWCFKNSQSCFISLLSTGESNEMGKISVCSVCWKRVEGTEIQQWQSNLHGQICIQTIKKTTVHYWILLVKNVPSSDGAIPFKLILVE